MNAQIQISPALTDRADRIALRKAWKQIANQRQATAAQHAIFTVLSGRSLDRAFTPITNPVKLANGMTPSQGREQALAEAMTGSAKAWAPFAELLEGATLNERWARRYYDMDSHEWLRKFKQAAS